MKTVLLALLLAGFTVTAAEPPPKRLLQLYLERLIVTEVNFRDAEPQAILEFLRQEADKVANPNLPAVNFVWLVPATAKVPRVTLTLKNVPLLEVVRYTTLAAGLRYRLDDHAVVISAPEPTPPPPNRDDQSP